MACRRHRRPSTLAGGAGNRLSPVTMRDFLPASCESEDVPLGAIIENRKAAPFWQGGSQCGLDSFESSCQHIRKRRHPLTHGAGRRGIKCLLQVFYGNDVHDCLRWIWQRLYRKARRLQRGLTRIKYYPNVTNPVCRFGPESHGRRVLQITKRSINRRKLAFPVTIQGIAQVALQAAQKRSKRSAVQGLGRFKPARFVRMAGLAAVAEIWRCRARRG